ncbi:SusC/RagA family TonB-linked outer membrane protein [Agriterribacter sp.]|uniref:SusC/RagA family TonB-linked outer membrane protein n=1 Tax=Agriterribacter sp. TaxID=2821509 RepID=UPI002C39403A|nr:SusC/RagA family TonB-linked outer membrane protein [Agriterribacter sp.]HRP57899.1 SusC/RagA family TonB-linked outer membrane protein [Agriterribacter sp.]
MHRHYKLLAGILLLLFWHPLLAQTVSVNGSVISKRSGNALEGVTIIVSGKSVATQTDINGTFAIDAPAGSTLIISRVGYQTQEIGIGSASAKLSILLEEVAASLDEVVITALGISRQRKSLGYAVQELKSSAISEAKEPNLVNALAGKIAGVRITNSQGDMGSSRIVIRGETSIAGNNQPLFVINGVPVDNSQLGAGSSRDYANAISDINAEDIESVSVLKGPNAAALYGSRAAAGVILIKTKTGKTKKGLGITFNSNVDFENLLVLPDYQNAYGQGSNGRFSYTDGKGGGINDGVDESWGPRLDGRLIPQFYSNGEAVPFVPHSDNVRDFFKTGTTFSNSISIADATEKFDYRISFNHVKQNGVIPNSEQEKKSVSLNTTLRLTSKLSVTANVNYFNIQADNLPGAGGKRSTSTMLQYTWFGRQVDINRLKNYRNADGTTFNWNNSYYSNPYFIAYENTVEQRRNRIIGHVAFNYDFGKGLALNFRSGTDYYNDRRKLKIAYGTNGTPYGSYQETGYTVNENNTEAILQYTKKLNSDFSIDVLGGANLRYRFYEENDQLAPRLAVADVYTLSNSRDPLQSSNYYSRLKTYSVFGSGQIGFRNYVFLNLTARNDWSSTLPSQNLSYFYPSANLSVILTDAFSIGSDFLSYAKIRGGWSKVGKDADPYQLINIFNFSAPFGTNPQLNPSAIDLNKDLRPETTTSAELGAELGFFSNRLHLDLSVYNTNSFDQILSVDVSPSTGYRQKLLNAGKINNKGIEVQLNVIPVQKGITWEVNLNYAANRSRVLELDKEGRLQNYVIGASGSAQIIASVGQPYGTIFGNAFLRNAKGQIVVNDDGAPKADPNKKILGKYTPDWLGGISNSLSYRGVKLSFLVDASIGGSIYSGTYATGTYTGVLLNTLQGRGAEYGGLYYYYPNNNKSNGTVQVQSPGTAPDGEALYDDGIIFDGVTADGARSAKVLSAQQYYKSFRTIDEANVFDASYVKLREVRLGYTFPLAWIRSAGFESASVALVGRNLWIIHKEVPHIDPETAFNTGNAQGLESLTLPTTRSYGFNITLKF